MGQGPMGQGPMGLENPKIGNFRKMVFRKLVFRNNKGSRGPWPALGAQGAPINLFMGPWGAQGAQGGPRGFPPYSPPYSLFPTPGNRPYCPHPGE